MPRQSVEVRPLDAGPDQSRVQPELVDERFDLLDAQRLRLPRGDQQGTHPCLGEMAIGNQPFVGDGAAQLLEHGLPRFGPAIRAAAG